MKQGAGSIMLRRKDKTKGKFLFQVGGKKV